MIWRAQFSLAVTTIARWFAAAVTTFLAFTSFVRAADGHGRAPVQLVLSGAGNNGAFDASLERDPATRTTWMSWSSVDLTPLGATPVNVESTRLARTIDQGRSWIDQGVVVNAAQPAPMPPAALAGRETIWVHEVSRLVYDAGAPVAERWKLLWHRYLVADGVAGVGDRHFEYGWIGLRAAASPPAIATAPERKLFAGSGYQLTEDVRIYNDAVIGPPEVELDRLDPALADCVAFTEPGATSTHSALYVSLVCATGVASTQRIVLLRWQYPDGPWRFVGTVLDAHHAAALSATFVAFSAPDLFRRGGQVDLVASPVRADGSYDGCLVFRFAAVDEARLRDRDGDGQPDVRAAISGRPGSFNGACGFSSGSGRSGFVYSQFSPNTPSFTLFASNHR